MFTSDRNIQVDDKHKIHRAADVTEATAFFIPRRLVHMEPVCRPAALTKHTTIWQVIYMQCSA